MGPLLFLPLVLLLEALDPFLLPFLMLDGPLGVVRRFLDALVNFY